MFGFPKHEVMPNVTCICGMDYRTPWRHGIHMGGWSIKDQQPVGYRWRWSPRKRLVVVILSAHNPRMSGSSI